MFRQPRQSLLAAPHRLGQNVNSRGSPEDWRPTFLASAPQERCTIALAAGQGVLAVRSKKPHRGDVIDPPQITASLQGFQKSVPTLPRPPAWAIVRSALRACISSPFERQRGFLSQPSGRTLRAHPGEAANVTSRSPNGVYPRWTRAVGNPAGVLVGYRLLSHPDYLNRLSYSRQILSRDAP